MPTWPGDAISNNNPNRMERLLASEMAKALTVDGRTKRDAARHAIMNAIRDGKLRPGDILPPEQKLTDILGVSLGTVQAGLKQLQQTGIIVRRRGDATRIASTEPLASSVWHFRFASNATGEPLRFADQENRLDVVTDQGDWTAYLEPCDTYVRIRRRIVMRDGTRVGAEMFLATATAPGLSNVDMRDYGIISIRPLLEERFGIVTAGATHLVKTTTLPKSVRTRFGLPDHRQFFEIDAKAYSNENRPVYFQRIYVSTTDCSLMF